MGLDYSWNWQKPPTQKISLQNSECWYISNPGSTIYLVSRSWFAKFIQNFEILSNWNYTAKIPNEDKIIEVEWFDKKLGHWDWTYIMHQVPKLGVITITNLFETRLKYNEVTIENSFEQIKSSIRMCFIKHRCHWVFIEVKITDSVPKNHIYVETTKNN